MLPKELLKAIFWSVLGAGACALFLSNRAPSPSRTEMAEVKRPVPSEPAPRPSAPNPASQSFEERLDAAKDRFQRGSIVAEWIARDRASAMRFLAASGFRDLGLPGVAEALGRSVTMDELLAIANGSEHPDSDLLSVGKWASPQAISGFASLMPSVGITAANDTARAVGQLLAGLSLDRAIAFSLGLPTDAERAAGVSGVFSELESAPNGEGRLLALYNSLPPSVQSADPALLRFYIDATSDSDPVAALQALNGITSRPQRIIAALVLAKNVSSSSPETAIAALYASGLPAGNISNRVNAILQNWAAVDPQGAANFISTTQVIPVADKANYNGVLPAPGGNKG
jgi:hypothetical protein